MRLEAGPGGRLLEGDTVVGTVISWEAGRRAVLEWRPASWQPDLVSGVEIRVEAVDGLSRLVIDQRGWPLAVGGDAESVGWFASEVGAPFLAAMGPAALGDWVTDRRARCPSGAESRATYRDPLYHYPSFRAILADIALGPEDYLLEVGCGGGAFLQLALDSGCRAAAVDHSPDMVRVARVLNREAIDAGRLEILEADAASLPLPDGAFTCAVMMGVLGFLPDPVTVLEEIRRVLAPDGRAVIQGTDPELRGTPAAPEPMESRLRFYDSGDLEVLGRAAGFESVRAVRRGLERYAREAGVPEEVLPLFSGGGRFLLMEKG